MSRKVVISFVLSVLILSSCMTMKPKFKEPVVNKRNFIKRYNQPYYVNRLNILGWSLNIGFSAGLGYAVYRYGSKIKLDSNLSTENNKILAGAGVGLLSTLLIYYFSDDGTVYDVNSLNAEKWLNDYDDDMKFIDYVYYPQSIGAIPYDADKIYEIRTLHDAKQFKEIYPNSQYTTAVVKSALPYFTKSELLELNKIFYFDKCSDLIKEYYFRKQTNIGSWIAAGNNFPYDLGLGKDRALALIYTVDDASKLINAFPDIGFKDEVESIAFGKIKNFNDCLIFNSTFGPNFKKTYDIDKLAFGYISSMQDVELFHKTFPDSPLQIELEGKSISFISKVSDLIIFKKVFPNSSNPNLALNKVLSNLSRKDIPTLVDMFPFLPETENLKKRYIDDSKNLDDCIDAATKFPDKFEAAAVAAAAFCNSVNDYRRFLHYFGESEKAIDIRTKYNSAIINKVENLGTGVNTSISEYSPKISPDGKTLYFVRRDVNDSQDDEDIFVSNLGDFDKWGTAYNIGSPLNNSSHNAVYSVTPDGNTLLLHNRYDSYSSGVSISNLYSSGWSNPISLDIDNFYNNSSYFNGSLSNEGNIILMSLSRNDSRGGNDIYVIKQRQDGTWSEPKNLGNTINTKEEESSIFLAADGKTIYFSSEGHGGYGGSDIFLSRRLGNSWTSWSKPVNLGSTINSWGNEKFYVIPASGEFAYYSSTKDSYGQSDIFRIGLPLAMRPNPVVLIAGKVINKKTNEPILAEIYYEDLKTGKQVGKARTNPITGIYKIILPGGKLYGFRAEAEGFLAVNQNIDLTNLDVYKESRINLELIPIEKGQTATMNNIFFDFGKFSLKKESFPELDRLAKVLKDTPSLTIEVSGHTDNVGSHSSNMKLSMERAQSVVNYLIKKGVPKKRLKAKGFGPDKPVVPNDSDANRQKNRRVEIKFI